ncbi:MAG: RING finger protein [Planctomycetota bacterium]
MDVLLSFAFFAGLLFVGYRVIRYASSQRACNLAFIRVGRRYNVNSPSGGVTYSFLISRPKLAFPYRETFCQLRIRKSRSFEQKNVTELQIQTRDDLPSMEVTTGLFERNQFLRDSSFKLSFDDANFREVFNAASDERIRANRLLTSSVCWQLEQLRRHTGSDQVAVSIRRKVMRIKKPGIIDDYQQLDDFVRFGLQLYDQLLLEQAQGIDFVNDQTASVIDDVKCPICSEEIVQDMVVCTRCKTPHCRDCWQYNGQCATFACSETRFLQVG